MTAGWARWGVDLCTSGLGVFDLCVLRRVFVTRYYCDVCSRVV